MAYKSLALLLVVILLGTEILAWVDLMDESVRLVAVDDWRIHVETTMGYLILNTLVLLGIVTRWYISEMKSWWAQRR